LRDEKCNGLIRKCIIEVGIYYRDECPRLRSVDEWEVEGQEVG
jgi:hypothetical protein